jgi:hypothetical protein
MGTGERKSHLSTRQDSTTTETIKSRGPQERRVERDNIQCDGILAQLPIRRRTQESTSNQDPGTNSSGDLKLNLISQKDGAMNDGSNAPSQATSDQGSRTDKRDLKENPIYSERPQEILEYETDARNDEKHEPVKGSQAYRELQTAKKREKYRQREKRQEEFKKESQSQAAIEESQTVFVLIKQITANDSGIPSWQYVKHSIQNLSELPPKAQIRHFHAWIERITGIPRNFDVTQTQNLQNSSRSWEKHFDFFL